MKRLLLALIMSLVLCGSAFAQTHWPGFDANTNNPYEDQAGLVAAIMIDGTPIDVNYAGWDALEIAAFVGDDIRANLIYLNDEFVIEFGDPYPVTWGDAIFYTTPGEELTFKMYDPSRDIEYDFVTALQYGSPLVLSTGDDHLEGWDNPDDVIFLSFTTPVLPTQAIVPWGDTLGTTSITQTVTIPDNTTVVIMSDSIAYAANINLGNGSSIIIEDGGQLYHNDNVDLTIQMNVTGYNTTKGGSGYRLFAAPIDPGISHTDFPTMATGLITTSNYDFYYFDESQQGEEWQNYKANPFDLELGKGYLYANASNDTVRLSGATKATNETVTVPLSYTDGKNYAGFNLVGNPYTCNAYVNKPYYKMNGEGSELDATLVDGNSIAPMKAVFVQATGTGQSCIFSTTPFTAKSSLHITVSQANAMVDAAHLCFGEGGSLEKFQLDPSHTKVYMPVDGKDYAVVSAENQGEMPVSFKAESNGTYSLDFSSTDTEFSYLHLIDNMTGNDVDLLQTPSYSFNALTTDYASRFRLVFATGTASVDNFGFLCDGNIIINGNNGGTVQVIDALGRILVSENGVNSVSTIGMTPGVYVLRLINGNDVKTQKIVVK